MLSVLCVYEKLSKIANLKHPLVTAVLCVYEKLFNSYFESIP